MSTKILKTSMLALAGAVALAAAGSASADPLGTYSTCEYKGTTTLTSANLPAPISCWLHVVAKVSCEADVNGNRHVHVTAAGANPGDPECAGLALANVPWGTDLDSSGGIPSGVIDTDHLGSGLASVYSFQPGLGVAVPVAGGILNGVVGTGTAFDECATPGVVPTSIDINGSFPGGDPQLQGSLSLRGCN